MKNSDFLDYGNSNRCSERANSTVVVPLTEKTSRYWLNFFFFFPLHTYTPNQTLCQIGWRAFHSWGKRLAHSKIKADFLGFLGDVLRLIQVASSLHTRYEEATLMSGETSSTKPNKCFSLSSVFGYTKTWTSEKLHRLSLISSTYS